MLLRWQNLLFMMSGLLLVGCFASTPAKVPVTVNSQSPPLTNLGQKLPISARAIFPNGSQIDLEVAQTPQQQAMGLMYRPALPKNQGMLFQFSSPQAVSFWMKNVPVPLDMVFLRRGVVQKIISAVPPCTTDPCPTYGPRTQIDQVIELRSGRAAELGLKEGDRVKIDFFNSDFSRRKQ